MSGSLDLDQAQHFVRPDLGPNCLQRLSADDTSRQRSKGGHQIPSNINGESKKRFCHKGRNPLKYIGPQCLVFPGFWPLLMHATNKCWP